MPLSSLIDVPSSRRRRGLANRILARAGELRDCDDARLREASTALRWRILAGQPPRDGLVEAFALVREAARRAVGQSHRPVQLLAGIAIFEGRVAEMDTGEGKTLAALLPAFLRCLSGRGVHVVTSNDYLAERDAGFARSILERLGVSAACVLHGHDREARRAAYAADVTYGTIKEFGFDFLRDRTASDEATTTPRMEPRGVQRGLHYALVDEADSILLDEARTPLIIAEPEAVDRRTHELQRWSLRTAASLEHGRHFRFDAARRAASLTRAGCAEVHGRPKAATLDGTGLETMFDHVERALTAAHGFARDRDYVVDEETIAIVDESTGRVLDGRKWEEGLHQAIEAKEGVPLTERMQPAARITVQSFLRLYQHLGGTTGTARDAARELRRTYGLRVTRVPRHRPCRRRTLPPLVFGTLAEKWDAVAREAELVRSAGRAVLVGTPSVAASESLSREMASRGLDHRVLNCLHHEREAEIVAEAGRVGRITIATNMAGRGTDIRVDDEVLERGGLHVIATEFHSSRRIDRQLEGRAARQGEPGTCRRIVSLEDELFQHVPASVRRNRASARGLASFRRAQRIVEQRHQRERRHLLNAERHHRDTCERMGLDPYLDVPA